MSFRHVMQKVKEYPQHHRLHWNFNLSHDDAALLKRATILPICWNDDGTVATDVDSNPMHASFAEVTNGACSPESKIFSISAKLQASFTILAWNTDKLRELKIQIIPIAVAFEDIDAKDDLTSLTVGSILSLLDEDTTNNTYPLYNNNVIVATAGQQVDMGTSQLGLTATTALEYVTFNVDQLFQMLSYGSNRGKLKACIGGIITRTVSLGSTLAGIASSPSNRGMRTGAFALQLKINLPSKAKFMNQKTFFGILVRIPTSGTEDNYGEAFYTTAVDHINFNFRAHFMEWNHSFNHQRTG